MPSVKITPVVILDVVTSYWIVFIDFEMSRYLPDVISYLLIRCLGSVENVDDSVFLIQGEIEGFLCILRDPEPMFPIC